MKNRYFFPIVLIMLIGILTTHTQSEDLFIRTNTSYPGESFNPGMLKGSVPEEGTEVLKQDLAANMPLPIKQQQKSERSDFFAIDSALDVMSIADPQLRALLSGNMNPGEKKEAENKENSFMKPEPVSQLVALYQGEERTFGYSPQKPAHTPADEFFYLEVKDVLTSQTEVYLEYDLFGVEDNTQVSRSINDQPVFGGYVVKQHDGWSKQSELINPDLLKQGINTIRFSIAENAAYNYKVKNLKLRIAKPGSSDKNLARAITVKSKKSDEIQVAGEEELKETGRRLIVNQPTTAYYYRRFGYLQGFVTGVDYDKAQIRIGGQKARAFKGEFESMISRNFQGQEEETDDDVLPSHAPWSTTVEAVFPDGEILSVEVTFEKPAVWDHLTGFDANIHYAEEEVTRNESFELTLATAVLQGEAGSLQESTNLSITALRAIDLPRLNPGMVNVTAGYDGYRFLPHGSNFDKPLDITIGYDSTKIPRGHYPQEIRTYYYDEIRSHWVALPRDSVNRGDYQVCSRTTHFTDMINAIVKAPDMPETQEYTPTSLKELQAADPSSGIQMMQPPTANSQGTANLSYPINVPAGRQGMQPNLSVTYSSEAGNGLLGMGWDMNIPAITVDTKWGVPRYSSHKETETYLYNGEELLPSPRIEGFIHDRYPSGMQFHPRVEGGFEKIIRKGTNPQNYFWIVTDKQGTIYIYGADDINTIDTDVLLKDDYGNIAHWPLCKVIDIHGNYMKYCYEIRDQIYVDEHSYDTIRLGKQLWLESISYTGHEGTNNEGSYKVVFGSEANMTPGQMLGMGCTPSGGQAGIRSVGSGIQKITSGESLIKSPATPANPDAEAQETARGEHCNVMLRKTDRSGRVLENVAFDLTIGIQLTTDNIGNTPYFPVNEGDWFEIYEKDAPRCCPLLEHSIQVHILDNCKIEVQPFYPVHQEMINGEYVHVITVINECDCIDYNNSTPTVIQKVDQEGRVLEGVVFKLEDGTELITNSEGHTFPFAIPSGGSMRIDEVHALGCCEPLPYPIHVHDHGNGHIEVEHGFSAYQGMVNGVITNIITITNKCDCPHDIYKCQTVLRKVDQEGRTIQGVKFQLDNGRIVTTDHTGSTQTFGIQEGEHITIHELHTLDCCHPTHLPIEIYGHGDCNLEVHPHFSDYTVYQEWRNGVYVNVITVENQCGCDPDDPRLNNCQTILRKVDQYGNILEGVAFQIENGGQLRTGPDGYTSSLHMQNGEHIMIHEVSTSSNCTPLSLPIEIKKHSDCDIEVNGAHVREEIVNGIRSNVIYITNYCPPANPCKLRIKKVDANGRVLQGAIFRASNGSTLTSNAQGYTSSINLQPGTSIILTEIQAPAGYQLNTQTIRIDVLDHNCNIRITPATSYRREYVGGEEYYVLTIRNELIPVPSDPCKLRIKKVNANGEPLQGAVFQTAGGLICSTGANGFTSDIPLEPGNILQLVETQAPAGYKRSTRIINIEVLENCSVNITPEMDYQIIQNGTEPYYVLTMINSPVGTPVLDTGNCNNCEFRIRKVNDKEEGLPGAVFQTSTGGTITTGVDGYSSYMALGDIVKFHETVAPDGYTLNSKPVTLMSDANCNASMNTNLKARMTKDDDCHWTVTITNSNKIYYYVHKIDEDGNIVEGAGFETRRGNDEYGDPMFSNSTDEYGNTPLAPLAPGQSYSIVEYHIPLTYLSRYQAYADFHVTEEGDVVIDNENLLESYYQEGDGVWVFVFSNKSRCSSIATCPPGEGGGGGCGCSQTYTPDLSINTRNGFRQSSKDKVTKIAVFYGDECVRSYDFCYGSDYFGRAKLQSIVQWSSGSEEKHVHYMEYYTSGEMGEIFSEAKPFEIENRNSFSFMDKISGMPEKLRNKLNSTMFRPSVLGGSRTWSFGINGGADLGLLCVFPLKTLSGGLYFTTGASYSKGRTTMMDINGDGLPDRVYSNSIGKVYYRLQVPGEDRFGDEQLLSGIDNFLQDKSSNYSFGFQISAGVHGGFQGGGGSSETKVYFTDMNGDGFPDLVNPNGVKFIGSHQNPPVYSLPECLPPVITVDSLPISIVCDTLPPIDPYIDTNSTDAVQYDFVRVWVADLPDHENLYYKIGGQIYFADMEDREMEYFAGKEDSLVLSIQWHKHYEDGWMDTLVWIDTLGVLDVVNLGSRGWNNNQGSQSMSVMGAVSHNLEVSNDNLITPPVSSMIWIDPGGGTPPPDTDSTTVTPNITTNPDIPDDIITPDGFGTTCLNNLPIKQGDTIYFRVHALRNGINKPLVWNPTVQPNIASLNSHGVETDDIKRIFGGGTSAAESQLLQSDSIFYCPFNGRVTISYTYQNSKPLEDSVYYEIWHNNRKINTFMIQPYGYFYLDYDFQRHYGYELSVNSGDSLRFIVRCGSNVNHTYGQWNPKITYTIAFDVNNTDTLLYRPDGDTLEYEIAPYYQYYHKILYLDYSSVVYNWESQGGYYPVTHLKASKTVSPVSIPVRFRVTQYVNGTRHAFTRTFLLGTSAGAQQIAIHNDGLPLDNNFPFHVSCFVPQKYAQYIQNACYVTINGTDYKCIVYTEERNNTLWGGMYGRWGQFQYLSDNLKLMDRSKIFMSAAYRMGLGSQYATVYADTCTIAYTMNELESVINDGEGDAIVTNYNRLMSSIPMSNEIQLTNGRGIREHRGYYPNSFMNKSYIFLGGMPAFDLVDEPDENDCSGNPYTVAGSSSSGSTNNSGGNNNSGNSSGNAPNTARINGFSKYSKSTTYSYSIGVSIPGIGIGTSKTVTHTKQINDLMDLNGDGFPDIIQAGYVLYSKPFVGQWEGKRKIFDEGCHHKSKTTSYTGSFTADPQGAIREAKNSGKGKTVPTKTGKSAGFASSVSATAAKSKTYIEDITHFTLIDVNGDGLPDRVYHAGNKNVALNLGYKFETPKEYWEFKGAIGYSLSNAGATSVSIGVGGGKSGANHSFSAGLSGSQSISQHGEIFIDMNADGLSDRVVFSGERQITVYFNSGCGFTSYTKAMEINFTGSNTPELYKKSVTNSLSGTISITLGFPIVFWAKISASLGADASFSISSENISFMDMDGDGYPDIIFAPSADEMYVLYSQLGKTGLLKKVINPLAGTLEMDYQLTDATVRHSRRQVLSEVRVRSNHENDTSEVMLTSYAYESGYYDRNEREFYGFAKVTEKQHNTRSSNNEVLRIVEKYYHNASKYDKGLNLGEVLADGDGNWYIMTRNRWIMRNPVNMAICTPATGRAYPALDSTVVCYYEGQGSAPIRKQETYRYDTYGRMIYQTSHSTDMPTLAVTVSYNHTYPANYNISVPSQVVVHPPGQPQNFYRKRTTGINPKGQLSGISDYYDTYNAIPTTISYDNYGNCTLVQSPNTSTKVSYENTVHTYPEYVRNIFGETSWNLDYDFRFGIPLTTMDIHGNQMQYTLDHWGRIATIRSPKEIDSLRPYTVKYEYFGKYCPYNDSLYAPFMARTSNFDVQHPDNDIQTYTFCDGLGRIVQTKADASINGEEKMIVSGRVYFDALGRAMETYMPAVCDTADTVFMHTEILPKAISTYDVLDRPLLQIAPDGTMVHYDYDFGNDQRRGYTLFKTDVIDQNGYTSTSLANVNQQQYEVYPAGHEPVWFAYSPIGDLTTVWGVDFDRSYGYDKLGRRTEYWEGQLYEHYAYQDENMVEKYSQWETQNIGSHHASLYYHYNHTRLQQIEQYRSDMQYNRSIYYEYNIGNRPIRIIDDSGIQLFEYGNMGEVTRQTRIFTPPGMNAFAVETGFEYDSWGRTLSMTYPDGEVVDYGYDHGGQLAKVHGSKSGEVYNYLDSVKYNEFGAKTEQTYGNDLTTYWQYNYANQRLEYQQIRNTVSGQNYMETQYYYDNIGNITDMYNNHYQGNAMNTQHQFHYDPANQLTYAYESNYGMYDLSIEYEYYGRIRYSMLHTYDPIQNTYIGRDNNYHYHNYSNAFAADYTDEGYHDPDNGIDYGSTVIYTYGINGSVRSRYAYEDGTGNPHENFYLFDAYGNMNAYCDNMETYAYYSYDDAGQRAYKMTFLNRNVANNHYGFPYLEQDKISFYPNGFVNINQNGEYTKHYYAETQRIASKIGTGSVLPDNLCDGLEYRYDIPSHIADELRYYAEDKMQQDLTFVVIPENWVEIEYRYDWICDLQGSGSEREDELFYYHGNHLSSTQMITDINGYVVQQIHYAPFGEVISEYNSYWHNGLLPDYMFNGKELDEESGMYYYEARYYAPPTFISRDPLFSRNPWMNPYAYCANNPVKYIDPTGLYEKEGQANRAQKRAVRKYGKENVGRVYKDEKTGEYGFRISKTGFKQHSPEEARKKGADAFADKGEGIFNNKELRKYGEMQNNNSWSEGMPTEIIINKQIHVVPTGGNNYVNLMDNGLERAFEKAYREQNNIRGKYWSPIADIRGFEALMAAYASAINPLPPTPISLKPGMDASDHYKSSTTKYQKKLMKYYKRYNIIR